MALELGLRLVVHLLDPSRVDSAILEQLLQRQLGDLAPHAVEAGEDHGAGGVVDDEVDAGEVLERTDVAALAADDPSLHLVRGELDDRDGGLGGMPSREPLHADGQDVANAPLSVTLGLLLDLTDSPGGIVASLSLDLLEQKLLCPRSGQPGDPLQGALELMGSLKKRLARQLEFRLAVGHRLLPAGKRGLAASQRGGALSQLGLGCRPMGGVTWVALPTPAERNRSRAGSQGRTVSLDAGRQGAAGPGRVGPDIKDGSEEDPYRDQRSGNDDVHGRSSP